MSKELNGNLIKEKLELMQIKKMALTPESQADYHWKTWLISLKSNNVYGHEFTFKQWLDRFRKRDLLTLRQSFLKYYAIQFGTK